MALLSNGKSASQADVMKTLSGLGITPKTTSSSTPKVNPNGILSGGKSADLKDVAATLNAQGIATPNYSQTTGLNDAGKAVLTAANLAQYTAMPTAIPEIKSPYTEGVVTSGMTGLALNTPTNVSTPSEVATPSSATDLFNQYITAKKENQMPSLSAEYAKAEKTAQIQQKQQAVNDYTAQLNTIAARQQSDLLSLRGTGAREGVTEAVYGGQAATINREAAIAALPVQAQLAAAQGNLQMAQERLDTLFKLRMEDAKNQYDFTNNIIDRYYNFANEQQKAALDAKKEEKTMDWEREKMAIAQQYDMDLKKVGLGITGGTTTEIGGTQTGGTVLTDTGKPMNDTQATSYGYAQRLSDADGIIDQIGSQFTGVSSYLGEKLPNVMQSVDRQKFEQAKRNFVNAVLRRESGAVISPSEFENAQQQYFPQPGDKPETLAQKNSNRAQVIENLYRSAGVAGQVQTQTVNTPEDLRAKYNY